MKIIIVTGGIGAGKSIVCAEFAKLGAKVISGDKIGHNCLNVGGSAYAETVVEFGEEILNPDRTINREKLGRIAFADRQTLDRLNEITHKHILKKIVEEIDNTRDCGMIIIEIPLFRAVDLHYDAVISVIAEDNVRIERVIERSGLSREIITSIIALQPTSEEYRGFADYCIENNGNISELQENVRKIYEEIKNVAV